jgi:hypothetical protein
MKKIFVLLLFSLVFLTGCTVKQVNNKDINKIVDTLLNKNISLYNQTSIGYKYYAPRGVRVIDSTSYNEKLFSNGYTYYLYVDVVSYHFKKEITYEVNKKAYLSKELNYNNRKGYLEINKIKNYYFIEMMFNYAKVEAFVSEEDIWKTVNNISYILNTLKFNDITIKRLFNENVSNFNEQKYEIFKPKENKEDFLDYEKEYDNYKEKVEDEDIITSDNTSQDQSVTSDLPE